MSKPFYLNLDENVKKNYKPQKSVSKYYICFCLSTVTKT